MKIWKILRKTVVFLLIPALALPLAGCVKDKRFDYTELNLRLASLAPAYAFEITDLFFADGVYYCYYSFSQPEDALLTMKEDGDGRLERVSLALAAPPTDPRFEQFREFALALAAAFLPDADPADVSEKTALDAPEAMLEHTLCRWTDGFYAAASFAAAQATCFILTYSTVYEK